MMVDNSSNTTFSLLLHSSPGTEILLLSPSLVAAVSLQQAMSPTAPYTCTWYPSPTLTGEWGGRSVLGRKG